MLAFSHDKNGTLLEIAYGDIAAQAGIDAIVNAANAQMASGTGVSGAIHRGAGPRLWDECKTLPPLKPGEAAITSAYDLPNQNVIHCLGPRHGIDEPSAELLASCYRRALELCEGHELQSIAFPAISTGAFYFPWKDAAEIAFRTVLRSLPSLSSVNRIRFVYHDKSTADKHAALLQRHLKS